MIPFNKPFLTGNETLYISDAVSTGKISGNGKYTKKCQDFFEKKYGFKKTLLTTSCTDALEMCAILANIQPGDEVIVPSFTFVSTALAFVRQGAKIVFADSYFNHPNIDADKIEDLITQKTKAIVVVHYAGIACDMDKIMTIATKNNLLVIEDAAHAIDSYYTDKNGKQQALGSIGHLAAFSFHETKNIIAGEGGMLVMNDETFFQRAEIIWEKGTNRVDFFKGNIDQYNWVDIGSSFLPSEIVAAFLWAQIENLSIIQQKRKMLWEHYYSSFSALQSDKIGLPINPNFSTNNGHLFYLVAKNISHRTQLIDRLNENGFHAVFHYQPLHLSPFYKDKHDGRILINADKFANCLFRLPLFYELETTEIDKMVALF